MRTIRRSNDGRVLSLIAAGRLTADPATGHVQIDGQLVGRALATGYIVHTLPDRRYGQAIYAHRSVWLACVGPISAGMMINHRNGRKWDNRLVNLDVVTASGNVNHAVGNRYLAGRPWGAEIDERRR